MICLAGPWTMRKRPLSDLGNPPSLFRSESRESGGIADRLRKWPILLFVQISNAQTVSLSSSLADLQQTLGR